MVSMDRKAYSHRRIFIGIGVIFSLLIVYTNAFGMTPAGTKLHTRVEATYTWQMLTRTTWSDWVAVTVNQVAAVQVTPESQGDPGDPGFTPAYDRLAFVGERIYIPYRVTNTGNGPDVFDLSVITEPGTLGLPPLTDPLIYLDLNEDGIPGASDTSITDIALAAGEAAALILSVRVPGGLVDGTVYFAGLLVTSRFDGSVFHDETWTRIETVSGDVNLDVTRSVDVSPLPAHPGAGGIGSIVAGQGAKLTHTITIDNLGTARAENATLWEALSSNELLLHDTYGPDKALMFKGAAVSVDPLVDPFATMETDAFGVDGIQLIIDRIEPSQRVVLQYEVEVDWHTAESTFKKLTEITFDRTPGVPMTNRSNEIVVTREGEYSLQIGPKGKILAPGEQGLDVRDVAYLGEKARFPTTITHTGTVAGTIELGVIGGAWPGWSVTLYDNDGVTPLVDTNGDGNPDMGMVSPGDTRDIIVEIGIPADQTLADNPPYTLDITALFAEDIASINSTVIRIDDVQPISIVMPGGDIWRPLTIHTDAGPAVLPGQAIQYAVVFGNVSGMDIYDVTIELDLNLFLEDIQVLHTDFGSAAWIESEVASDPKKLFGPMGLVPIVGGYDPVNHGLTWTIAHVPPDWGGKLVFQGQAGLLAGGGQMIDVQGIMMSDSPDHQLNTNVVLHTVLGDALQIDLTSERSVLRIGDINTYTVQVTNLNQSQDFTDVTVRVDLDGSVTYIQGSSILDGAAYTDPATDAKYVEYVLPLLPAGETSQLSFSSAVNATAKDNIHVSAQASIRPLPTVVLESRVVTVQTPVKDDVWSEKGTIIGRVTIGDDWPAPGVRVLLDGGRYSVTDTRGNYTLSGVESGPRAMRLDPATLREIDGVPGGVNTSEPTLIRAVIPSGGVAIVNFKLVPNMIGIETDERPIEEDD